MNSVHSVLAIEDRSAQHVCQTCAHRLALHDAVSLRWCAATKLGIGTRACICAGLVSGPRVLSHY
jgi:hypothetical protein